MKGQKISLDVAGASGPLERFEGAVERAGPFRIDLRKGEGIVTIELGEVAARSLAEIWLNRPGKKPEDAALAALVCLLEGDLEAAKAGMKGVPERFVEAARKAAEVRGRPEPREGEARKAFAEAERDALVPGASLDAIRKFKGLLYDYSGTGFVRRNRASVGNRVAEIGQEYFFVALDLVPAGYFGLGKNSKAKVDACWICDRDLDATVRDTYVDLVFGALAETEYRCWVYVGGCCQETLSFTAQVADSGAPLAVKIPYLGLKAKHAQHTGPKEPDRWTWVPIPLPKGSGAGVRTIRLSTTQKGFGVACAFVTSLRAGPPRDADLKDLDRSRAAAPRLNPLSADDLVAYWKFDEGSGAVAADASGKGHTGQFRGDATWGPGRSGTALVLSGNDGFVEVADAPDLNPPALTIAAWVSLPVAPPKGGNIVAKGNNRGYRFRAWQGGILQFLDRGAENILDSTVPVPLNQWTHVALCAEAAGLRVYMNGKPVGSKPTPFGAPPTATTFKIGAETEYAEYVVGSIDEVCLYKKALTSAEVQALYRLGPKLK